MKRGKISIKSLILSEDNPRLDLTLSEEESIYNMVKNQNNKLYVLALDIVKYGLNPLDTIAVCPSDIYEGYYKVYEGNRRICSLKLLLDPEQLRDIDNRLYLKFKQLSESYIPLDSIEVGIFENEEEIQHWMEIRHMGEQKGKGVSNWNTIQKDRYSRIRTGKNKLLDFWDWIVENNILSEKEICSITKTNWLRILRAPYFLFMKIQNGEKYTVLPKDVEIFTERIRAIQKELAHKSVAIVYDNDKIEDFFNNISKKLYNKPFQMIIDQESNQLSLNLQTINNQEPIDINLINDHNLDSIKEIYSEKENIFIPDQVNKKDEKKISVSKDLFNGCSTIIPRGYSIHSSNMRLNKVINELKRLRPDEFPNACGTLLRTLFELSAKVFLENQDGVDKTSVQFENAIRQAANQLRNQNRINNAQHSAISKDVDNLRMIFNGYMHNTEIYPSSETLKNFFKSHRKFIEECLK